MDYSLNHLVQPFRAKFDSQILNVEIDCVQLPVNQKIIDSVGQNDVINGIATQPVQARVSGVAYLRWIDSSGRVINDEHVLSFVKTKLSNTDSNVIGFELFFKNTAIFDVKISTYGTMTDLTNYYTRTQIDALLADKANVVNSYIKSEVDALLALKAASSDTYSKSEVLALIASAGKGFNYDGTAVPSAPTDGQTWRERTIRGTIKQDWFWDAVLSVWSSLHQEQLQFYKYLTNDGQITPQNNVLYSPEFRIRLTRITYTIQPSVAQDDTNYWEFVIRNWDDTTNLSPVLDTKALNSTATVSGYSDLTALLPDDKEFPPFIRGNKHNAAGNLDANTQVYYRYERP